VILSVVRCLLIWKNKKVCDIVILLVVRHLLIWKNKKVTLLLIWKNKKVCDELCSQAPYRWANGTKFNPAQDLNPESPDGYNCTQSPTQTGLKRTIFCSKDRCSTIEPLKQGEVVIKLIFVIFCFFNTFSKVTGKTGQGWLWQPH
jgi:hypothetical protein